MKLKKFIIGLFLLAMLIPIPINLKDGGSVRYRAAIYEVTRFHTLDLNSKTGYIDGLEIKILGHTIYMSVKN
ncbi:Uncharacterised protein [Chlamydia trachomatis]|nr:Uncharacterised protein [Chlamydia trachomatis]